MSHWKIILQLLLLSHTFEWTYHFVLFNLVQHLVLFTFVLFNLVKYFLCFCQSVWGFALFPGYTWLRRSRLCALMIWYCAGNSLHLLGANGKRFTGHRNKLSVEELLRAKFLSEFYCLSSKIRFRMCLPFEESRVWYNIDQEYIAVLNKDRRLWTCPLGGLWNKKNKHIFLKL